jgi:hypothetical protein
MPWGTATQLNAAPSDLGSVDVAINASGNGMAVWCRHYGQASIWGRPFVSGQWGPVQQISAGVAIAAAQVAIDDSGRALAVWRHQEDFARPTMLLASTYEPSTGQWSTPATIQHDAVVGHVIMPRLAMTPSGEGLLAVQQDTHRYDPNTPTPSSIWAVHYSPVTGWDTPGHELLVHDAADLDVTVDRHGNGMVVFHTGAVDIFATGPVAASRFSADTKTFSQPVLLEPAGGHSQRPRVAVNQHGQAVVTWSHGPNHTTLAIYANRFVNGQWLGPQALENAQAFSQNSEVALADTGDAVAVWWNWTQILASRFAGAWSAPQQISSTELGVTPNQYGLSLAMTANGTALAAWHEVKRRFDELRLDLTSIVRRYANGVWSTPQNLDAPALGFDYETSEIVVGLSENQSALAVWVRGPWSADDVWGNYQPPPPPPPSECGGFLPRSCPDGSTCQDVPDDGCDPKAGGADCPGMCVPGNGGRSADR